MGWLQWLRPDAPALTPAQSQSALQTAPARTVQQALRQGGWLGRTAISGGDRTNRWQLVQAALDQAKARGLPCLVLTGCPEEALPGYDPFPGHTRQETAFLLAQGVRWGQNGAADEVAFSLEAALAGWQGQSLAEFAAASCEQMEEQAQQWGALPFAERAEFRKVYYLMQALRTPGPQRPGASLATLLDRGGGAVFLPDALHWAMALTETRGLLPQVLVVAENVPWRELPGLLPPFFHGSRMVVGPDLPGELPDADWQCLAGRATVGVAFAHPNALSAQKLAEFYGQTYAAQQEETRTHTTAPLQPWAATSSRGSTTHWVRQNQILPETLQNLAPGHAVVQTPLGRCLCTFRAG